MASVNKATILGNLGRDPELSATSTGTPHVRVGIATSRKRGDEEETVWHNCHFWGKDAENFSKMAVKGGLCYVEGRVFYSEWQDKEGNQRSTHGISVNRWQWLGKREAAGAASFKRNQTLSELDKDDFADDDMPF